MLESIASVTALWYETSKFPFLFVIPSGAERLDLMVEIEKLFGTEMFTSYNLQFA